MSAGRSQTGAVLRGFLVAVALVTAVWLALSLRNERLLSYSSRSLSAPTVQASKVRQSLRDARTLNASRQPELLEAALLKREGESAAAIRVLRSILQKEPDNRPVWLLLSTWLRPLDPRGADDALARARTLDGKP